MSFDPTRHLGQAPQRAEQLKAGCRWFVYEVDDDGEPVLDDGEPVVSPLFARLQQITEPRRGPLVGGLLAWLGNPLVRWSLPRMGLDTPYLEPAALQIAQIAFGSVVRAEHADPGMTQLYELIAPAYDVFHQYNTGVVPVHEPGELRSVGPLPLCWMPTERLGPEAPLYPNDAVGRDRVAEVIVDHLQALPAGPPRRVLGVGDGPGLTTMKMLEQALEAGLHDVEVVVLEPSAGQLERGRTGWERLQRTALGARLQEHGLAATWHQGSGAEPPFPDASFAAAFSTYVVGAMGHAEVVERYATETLRCLEPGGPHVVLDFYDRHADPEGYATTGLDEPGQRQARASARLLAWLSDPQLRQTYAGIWDHHLDLNEVLDRASERAGAALQRTHRQTRFLVLPLLRVGPWTLAFTFSGYNERRAIYRRHL